MKDKYPQIEVHITRGISSELYRKVLDGDDLDAAIITQPPFAIPKSCDWRLLREEPFDLLTRAPAASRKPLAILASEPFIRLDRNIWPGRLVDGYLRKAGIRPRELFEIDGFEASQSWWIEGSGCHSCQIGRRRGRRAYRSPNCRLPDAVLFYQSHRPHMGQIFASSSTSACIPGTGNGGAHPRCQTESA